MLGEGKDSKQLSIPEEERLLALAYELRTKYYKGYVTPKELRDLAERGHTNTERVLISALLRTRAEWPDGGEATIAELEVKTSHVEVRAVHGRSGTGVSARAGGPVVGRAGGRTA